MLIYKNIVNYIKQWPPIMLYLLNTRGVTSNQQKFYVTGMSYFYVFITTCYLGRVYLKCMFIHILHIQVCLYIYYTYKYVYLLMKILVCVKPILFVRDVLVT